MASNVRDQVLDAIQAMGAHGLTADECASLLDVDRLTVRPRTSELRAESSIIDSGERRPNDSGKMAIVWKVR